ncbi:MAG: MFS transporter [Planctomycetaceae bacterium]|nr:MFS transporter [Planctomycetaceae bacterium]
MIKKTLHIPRGVWVLGFVSLLMDTSSEMIHALLPLFLIGSLGTSIFVVGLIEGAAEGTSQLVKLFSGALSDWFRRRKELTVCGYGLGALSKILFALAPTAGVVFTARMIDRVGKGIRGAPRDALITDITPAEIRGAAFGLRQALDTVGAFLGPLIAVALLLVWTNRLQSVFWVAAIPGVLAVALLFFGLDEPGQHTASKRFNPIRWKSIRQLGCDYWWVVFIGMAFTLARFSEAFLVILAMQSGIQPAFIPLVMVAMSFVYSITAYPFGKLSDRLSHGKLLAFGLLVLVCADIVLAIPAGLVFLFMGIVLWGIHMGMTEGLLSVMISRTAPEDLRGTAFGFFGLLRGLVTILASIIAGTLWECSGAMTTFLTGAVFACLALVILIAKPETK